MINLFDILEEEKFDMSKYKKLTNLYHPDKPTGDEEKMKKLNKIRDELNTKELDKIYSKEFEKAIQDTGDEIINPVRHTREPIKPTHVRRADFQPDMNKQNLGKQKVKKRRPSSSMSRQRPMEFTSEKKLGKQKVKKRR
jgi:curved DNA-binding protein CbpA